MVAARAAGKCAARNRARPPRPCGHAAMANGRCHNHGGKSTGPKTLAAGGRYSKGLGRLASQFEELLSAVDLLDIAPGLALLDLATNMRLQRGVEQGDTPQFRQRALELLKEACEGITVSAEQAAGPGMAELARLRGLLEAGVRADQALSEVVDIADRRNRTTTRVLDLQLRAEQAVPRAIVSALLAVISASIRAHAPTEAPAIFADIAGQLVGLSRRAGVALRLGEGRAALDATAAVSG